MNRREFLKFTAVGLASSAIPAFSFGKKTKKPDIILMMTDDQGWGDVGFNGNTEISTPNLDGICSEGANLYHFFSGGPVCSPTRGTCLSGRHYFRYGIWQANSGRLPRQEYTLPQGLKDVGYQTGHFGKWHLGSPHPEYTGKGGGGSDQHLARPEWFGYDKYFVTHHSVKTWNPYGPDGSEIDSTDNPYWEDGKRVSERLTGDDSRIIMDRAIPFIEEAVKEQKPFFSVIWSHTPHGPLEAGPEYAKIYEAKGLDKGKVKYYGSITALDDQVGRLKKKLKELDQWDNTILWFCSDNGPAHDVRNGGYGSTGGMRGKKSYLFNGGVCVPAFLYWKGKVEAGSTIKTPMSTLDFLPTLFEATGAKMPDARPVDGENVLNIVSQKTNERKKPIPFRHKKLTAPCLALIDDKYKYYTNFDTDQPVGDLLYDIFADRAEEKNLIDKKPETAQKMRAYALEFLKSCEKSHSGLDYPKNSGYAPIGSFQDMANIPWDPNQKKKKKSGNKKQKKIKKRQKKTKKS